MEFLILLTWQISTHSFQNQQRIESCLMLVWAKSLLGIHRFMGVQHKFNLKIQIWSLIHSKRTQSRVEFQAILNDEIYLKVEWVVKNDQEELL